MPDHEFAVWAPKPELVRLDVDGTLHPMTRSDDGWWRAVVDARVDSRYGFVLDDDPTVLPDPRSPRQPDGVHERSQLWNPSTVAWSDSAWGGRSIEGAVIYELHVGSFTPEGSYAAAQAQLPELVKLGITAVQLMPLADFPGRFGWGYDGVLPFAPHAALGSPDALKRFIDHAHALGLMVFLDVVYNHFGPDGNYLPAYAPAFFSDSHHTAWGAAVNFDGPGSATVREFFAHNVLYWLGEYRFDGLRFDAVHAMIDESTPDIMQMLSERARAAFPGRHIHLMLENDSNDVQRLAAPGTPGRFEGQWNGDFHHPLHVLLTNEGEGYYAEYLDDTLGQLARSLTHGLVWQGGPHNSEHAPPRERARSAAPLTCMVNFLQNHDQIGNRAFGERLLQLVGEADAQAALRLSTALFLLQPSIPMLFMGEEFGADTPFVYFSDWQGDLKQAVTEGRRKEFAKFPRFSDPAVREHIPDPCALSSFESSRIDRQAALTQPAAREWQALYAELLALRQTELTPLLPSLKLDGHASERLGPRALWVRWNFRDGRSLQAAFNLSPTPVTAWPRSLQPSTTPWFSLGSLDGDSLGAWSGVWWWTDA